MIDLPALSVILIVDRQRPRGARCLASILAQDGIERLEVLLVDLADDSPLHGSDHPAVRTLRLPGRDNLGTVMAEAVRQARAPVVAFLQEHCTALPGWARALITAHQGACAAVVGQVLNDNPTLGPSRAIYLVNYARFNDPTARGATRSIVRHNTSYKRDILLRCGDRLAFYLLHDPLLVQRLISDGYTLCAEPDARFMHAMETDLPSCWKINFIANRVSADVSVGYFNWSPARRLLYVAASPLMPFIRYARLLHFALTNRRWLLAPSLRYAPHVVSIYAAAVLGQTIGIVFGKGRGEQLFMFYELNEYRGISGFDVLDIHSPWI